MKTEPMAVTLVDHMGNDLSVVNAARVSFDKQSELSVLGWKESYDECGDVIERTKIVSMKEEDRKLLSYLAKHNHWSPFSHAYASFRIKAPIFVARQLVKHQVGLSWNEVSRRYVDSEPSFYFPTTWRSRPEGSVKQGSGGELCNEQPSMDINKYTSATITNCVDLYKDLLAVGMCPEQARMFLPQNMLTEWIWSGSLYAFARVCNLRMDGHSQKETREVAYMISNIMEKLFPESWKVLVKGEEK